MKRITALLLALCLGLGLSLQTLAAPARSETLPDLYGVQRTPAVVFDSADAAQQSDASIALVRGQNGKISFMSRDDGGSMQPFYPLAMETGYWDSRLTLNNPPPTTQNAGVVSHLWDVPRTGWNDVFADIASTGANTVQVTIHWANWEPEKDQYDFSFCDSIVEAAAQNGLKTIFVIFFHYQMNFISPEYDDLWMYHLDDRTENGKVRNYAIQWGGYDSIADARAMYNPPADTGRREIYLEYWHPQVFGQLMEGITALARHYKDSPYVLGYQLGNEEGFCNTENGGNDQNPYYQQLFASWKEQTGKTEERQFRLDTVNGIWTAMNNAVHAVDPYKFTTSNLQTANVEKSGGFVWADGADMDFYKNLDAVGTMFYDGAENVYNNLDKHYTYTTELPVLFPTEISSNPRRQKMYVAETVERGGQGYGIYCYGELFQNFRGYQGEPTANRTATENVYSMMKNSMDILWGAMPRQEKPESGVWMSQSSDATARLTVLDGGSAGSTGVLYYPSEGASGSTEITLQLSLPAASAVQVLGSDGSARTFRMQAGESTLPLRIEKSEIYFVNVREGSRPEEGTEVTFRPWPDGAQLTASDTQGNSYTAGPDGVCILPQGEYTYEASAPEGATASGSISVGKEAISVDVLWSRVIVVNDSEMGEGLNRFSYDYRHWTYYETENGVSYPGCEQGDVHWTPSSQPAQAQFTFYGNRLELKVFHNNATRHTFTVSIDGGPAQEFIMPEGIPSFASGWITVAEGLENARHTAVITKTSTSGGQFGIDAARVTSAGTAPLEPGSRIAYLNNDDPAVTYSSQPVETSTQGDQGGPQEAVNAAEGWAVVRKTNAINSGWSTTTKEDAWYEVRFYGTDLRIFSAREPYLSAQQNALGEIRVYLDGEEITAQYESENPGGFTDHTGSGRGQLSYFPLQVLQIHAGEQNAEHTVRVEVVSGQSRIDYAAVTTQDEICRVALETNDEKGGSLTVFAEGAAVENGAYLPKGTEVQVAATAAEGYTLRGVTVNGTPLETGTFTVEEDAVIRAEFVKNADRKALQDAVDKALQLDLDQYQDNSAKEEFGLALADAQALLNNPAALQEQLDSAAARLLAAMESLVPKPQPSNSPAPTDAPTQTPAPTLPAPSPDSGGAGQSGSTQNLPATGDAAGTGILLCGIAMASMGTAALALRKA